VRKLEEILERAKHIVVPSSKEIEALDTVAKSVLRKTEVAARKHDEIRDVFLGGSYAKHTWLPGEADIDIFIRFDVNVPEESFERIGLRVGREATRGYPQGKMFSQHPYTEADVDDVKINIVPCYAVAARKWKSAADRSPFHVELVRENLNEEQRLEVRLLKKFMKSVGVYGAEIETEGFSGYVAEVLVIKHGSFMEVLRSFASLERASEEKLLRLPDPVDENRDLARAISNENIAKFVLAVRAFLNNPSLRFFSGVSGKKRTGLERYVVAVRFSHPKLSEDILWGELKRTMRHLKRHAEQNGFRLTRATVASDNGTRSAFLMIPESGTLSELEERVGPSVEMRKESDEFVTKNAPRAKLIWVGEDSRLHVLQLRKHREISSLLRELLGREVRNLGASPGLTASLRRTAKVLDGRALVANARKEDWLLKGLEKIVSDSVGTNPD
jgi:tRNA nucleotidyltransferase (CCA-adding enzyme)